MGGTRWVGWAGQGGWDGRDTQDEVRGVSRRCCLRWVSWEDGEEWFQILIGVRCTTGKARLTLCVVDCVGPSEWGVGS